MLFTLPRFLFEDIKVTRNLWKFQQEAVLKNATKISFSFVNWSTKETNCLSRFLLTLLLPKTVLCY